MAGSSFSLDKGESSDDIPIHSGVEEETPTCSKLISIFGLGLALTLAMSVLFLGFIVLYLNVLIPIGHWPEGPSIPWVILLVLSLLVVSYVIGIINRFGVERISKTNLPRNRKWIFLHGFIVTLIGWILIYNLLGFFQMIEPPESYWIGLVSLMISNGIQWSCLLLVGLVGYLVAVKLPVFRNKSHSQVVVHSEAS